MHKQLLHFRAMEGVLPGCQLKLYSAHNFPRLAGDKQDARSLSHFLQRPGPIVFSDFGCQWREEADGSSAIHGVLQEGGQLRNYGFCLLLRQTINLHFCFLTSTSHAMEFRSLNTTSSGLIPHPLRFDSALSLVHLTDQNPSAVATNRDPGDVTTCCPVFS